ncbi:hypothetical protein SRED_002324 [Spiroplasma melliferum]|uniref:Spiroplasmavirus-related protein n=1 Tax=Spiroplasma melliferum TaxID=2134 RepID=A0ABX5UBE2_SPIME|nr:hypothetical protein SRED_002324 [Spiroplasma melliferum]
MKKYFLIASFITMISFSSISFTQCSCSGHTTQCKDGTWSNSSGKGTCSGHGGIKRNKVKKIIKGKIYY